MLPRLSLMTLLLFGWAGALMAEDKEFADVKPDELRKRAEAYFKPEQRRQELEELGVAPDYSGIDSKDGKFVWKYRATKKIEDPALVGGELKKKVEDMLGQAPGYDFAIVADGLEYDISEAPPAPKPVPQKPLPPPPGSEIKFSALTTPQLQQRAADFFGTERRKADLEALAVQPDFKKLEARGNTCAWRYLPVAGTNEPVEATALSLQLLLSEMLQQAPTGQAPVNVEGVQWDIAPGAPGAAATPEPGPAVAGSLFDYPEGLSMPPELLFARLGHRPGYSVPMTPEYCFDLAYACWIRGGAPDAIILAKHGLQKRNDARLHYLLGVALLQVNKPKEAELVAHGYADAVVQQQTFGLGHAIERINGPVAARFGAVLRYQAAAASRP